MTGRAVMWAGWLTFGLSMAGMAAYFGVVGFHLADVVGSIAVVVGLVGLLLGLYGVVLARREVPGGASLPDDAALAGGLEEGELHNTLTSTTIEGPVVLGQSIGASVSSGTDLGASSPPPEKWIEPQTAEPSIPATTTKAGTGRTVNRVKADTVNGPVVLGRTITGQISSGGPGAVKDRQAKQPSGEPEE